MRRSPLSSLRARALLVVMLAVIPALALTLVTGLERRRFAAQEARQDALQLAEAAVFEQEHLFEQTRQLLTLLALQPQVRPGDPEACNALMADLLAEYPHYANLGAIRPNGDLYCSALPFEGQVNLSDRTYFQGALLEQDFTIGDFQIGRVTGVRSVNVGYPLQGEPSEVLGVVFAALDLSWLNEFTAEVKLPPGATLTVVDHNGTILARNPDSEEWVGKDASDAPVVVALLSNGQGTVEAPGLDGVQREYAYMSLFAGPTVSRAYVYVGLPSEPVYAEANRILRRNLLALGLVAIGTLAAARYSSNVLILRPMERLLVATRRLAGGDLTTRSGLRRGPTEFTQLGLAFDEMAASLEGLTGRLRNLREIDRAIISSQTPEAISTAALDRLARLVPSVRLSVVLFDLQAGTGLKLATRTPHPSALGPGTRVPLEQTGIDLDRLRRGEVSRLDDLSQVADPGPAMQLLMDEGVCAYLSIPLRHNGVLLGALNAGSQQVGAFADEQVSVLREVSDQLAIAVQQARLYAELEAYSEHLEEEVVQRTAELQREKNRIAAILDSAPDPVLITDRVGVITRVNPAFEAQTGYRSEEVVGQSTAILRTGEEAPGLAVQIRNRRDEGGPWRTEMTVRRKDGSQFEADVHASPLLGDDGLPYGYVGVLRDVSESKEMERLKDAFVSNVSHELRTPVTSLKLLLSLLETTTPDKQDQMRATLQRETERLNMIIEDVLRLSRLDQERVPVERAPVDFDALVRQYVADRSPLAEQMGRNLAIGKLDDLEPIQADEGLLGQVLNILLSNALNYTPRGGSVTVSTARRAADGRGWAVLSVSDDGPGIAPDEQALIFERFSRGTVGRESSAPGSGLGLAIATEIVSRHGGRIEVESEGVARKGATFNVWLPADGAGSVRGQS